MHGTGQGSERACCCRPRCPAPQEANGLHPDHAKLGYVPRTPGERLAGSYINHYIANGGVVVPQFGGLQVRPAAGRSSSRQLHVGTCKAAACIM
jgi:hypothetical protein